MGRTNFGVPKILGLTNLRTHKFLCQKKFGVEKNLGSQQNFCLKKMLGLKEFWVLKNLSHELIVGQKKLGLKKFGYKKMCQKNFCVLKKVLGTKQFWATRCPEKFGVQKRFLVKKKFENILRTEDPPGLTCYKGYLGIFTLKKVK